MITNISDRKDTSFLSINKALSNKIKFSLLKKVFFLYFEWHFHEFLERCSILEYNIIVCCPMNGCQDIFCKKTLHTYALFGLQKLNTLNSHLF